MQFDWNAQIDAGAYGGGSGYPGSSYGYSWGEFTDDLQALGGNVLEGAVDDLTSAVMGSFTDPGQAGQSSQDSLLNVSPGRVQGLGAVLAFMQSDTPPANNAGRDKRGNYVRTLTERILGIPKSDIYDNETAKRHAYELFRAYLAAFDVLTSGAYGFKATVPPSEPPRWSEGAACAPYTLYTKLQSIGPVGLRAIDAMWNGQGLSTETQEYLGDEIAPEDQSAWDQFLAAIGSVAQNLLDAAQTTGQAAVEGAVVGATTTSTAANQGASAGRATFLGIPQGTAILGIIAIALAVWFLRK